MDTEDQSQPAGGDSAPTDNAPEALTLDAAASKFDALENMPIAKPEGALDKAQSADDSDDFSGRSAGKELKAGEEAPEELSADDDEDFDFTQPPQQDQQQDEDDGEETIVHGNAFTRLSDGRKVRVADLKKLVDYIPQIQQREAQIQQALEAVRTETLREVEVERSRIATQAQILDYVVPLAITKLRSEIPDPVPEEIWQTDELRAIRMERFRNQKIDELRQLEGSYQAHYQQRRQQAEAELKQLTEHKERNRAITLTTEFKKLVQKLPALQDRQKAALFAQRVKQGAEAYGFSEDELRGITDHRVMYALADLAKLRRLQTQMPKINAKAPPQLTQVRQPGRRVSTSEVRATNIQSAIEKVRKTGSIEDAARAFDALG